MTGALNYVRLYKGLATEAIYPYISAVMLILSYIAELHIYEHLRVCGGRSLSIYEVDVVSNTYGGILPR